MKVITSQSFDASQQKPTIDPKTRRGANLGFQQRGLDGNTMWDEIGQGITEIHGVLEKYGLVIADVMNADLFMGDSGSRTFSIQRKPEGDPFTPGMDITNSMVAFSWHKMPSGRYELIAYLS